MRTSFPIFFSYRIWVISVKLVGIPECTNLNTLPSENLESCLKLSIATGLNRNHCILYSVHLCRFRDPGGHSQPGHDAIVDQSSEF